MMEQHITRVSEAREEAVGSGCDHGPSVALVNPLQLLMAWVWPVPPALFTRCDALIRSGPFHKLNLCDHLRSH
jgi:hypothetical protein